MHALVTGASGFLGGRLVPMLLAQGIEVSILARPSSLVTQQPGLQVLRAELVPGLSHDAAFIHALAPITHVFHCAGCSTDWAPQARYQAANIDAVRAILGFATHLMPRLERFLHVSTTDIYGYPVLPNPPSEHPAEAMRPRDTGLPYNATKLRGEQLVWLFSSAGLPVTVVRPASIYGPGGTAFVTDIVALLRQRLMLLVDGGRAPGGFVYVDDVCRAMLLASVAPAALSQAYNLSSTDGVTWRAYTHALARALHLPAPWLQLPFGAAMALARASELPHKAGLPGRPLLTQHAVHLLGRDQQYSTAKAHHHLGWIPQIPLKEGIAHSIAGIPKGNSA